MLLIYQFFGPYHLARYRHWSGQARQRNWEPLGLQIFERPDLYNWTATEEHDGLVNLGLSTRPGDRIRSRDLYRLSQALSALKPDVVVVNGWGMRDSIFAHLWCRVCGIPRVLVTDSQAGDFRRSFLKEKVKQLIIQGVGSAFVAGSPQRRYAIDLGIQADRITDGCDVVDNNHFAIAREQRSVGGYRVLTISRWSPEKNLLAAAESFMRFVKTRSDSEPWVWKLVGYGTQENQLREIASSSQGRIELLGSKTYSELPAVFADADLYWQPSIREPWALVVNEAMAAGLPVLVSNRCGCREDLVQTTNGWVFDPGCHESMVASLSEAAAARDRWPVMGEASANLIQQWGLERFSDGLNEAVDLAVWGPTD